MAEKTISGPATDTAFVPDSISFAMPAGAAKASVNFSFNTLPPGGTLSTDGIALVDDVYMGPVPACTKMGDRQYQCGDIAITKTGGEGDFYPYFELQAVGSKGNVRLKDANCPNEGCTYKISTISNVIDAGCRL